MIIDRVYRGLIMGFICVVMGFVIWVSVLLWGLLYGLLWAYMGLLWRNVILWGFDMGYYYGVLYGASEERQTKK